MKKILFIFLFGIIALNIFPVVSLAQTTEGYKMLAPIPALSGSKAGYTDLNSYIPNMIKLIIAIAGGLAVIMIMVGGIKYITSAAAGGKTDGKETIQNAILGLLLAISAYTILNTINPKLVNPILTIDGLAGGTDIPTVPGGTQPTDPGAGPRAIPDLKDGSNWGDDSLIRNRLIAAGIGFNNNNRNCKTVGEKNCTSVYQLNSTVERGLIALKNRCNCTITITGGTEYWLHGANTRHRPQGLVVDLRLSDSVSTYLRSGARYITNVTNDPQYSGSRCATGSEKYRIDPFPTMGLFVNEKIAGNADHWHVCYY